MKLRKEVKINFFLLVFFITPQYRASGSQTEGGSQLGAAISLGFVIGPGIGGLLAEFGIRIPFVASALFAGLAMIISCLFFPESLSKQQQISFRNASINKNG